MKKNEKQVVNFKGKEITLSNNDSKEIQIFLDICNSYKGKTVTFDTLVKEAIKLRPQSKYALTPFNKLAKKVQTNFINRFAKTLGNNKTNGKDSLQSWIFNLERITGLTPTFKIPIEIGRNTSPQVKANEQTIKLPNRVFKRNYDPIKVSKK